MLGRNLTVLSQHWQKYFTWLSSFVLLWEINHPNKEIKIKNGTSAAFDSPVPSNNSTNGVVFTLNRKTFKLAGLCVVIHHPSWGYFGGLSMFITLQGVKPCDCLNISLTEGAISFRKVDIKSLQFFSHILKSFWAFSGWIFKLFPKLIVLIHYMFLNRTFGNIYIYV